MIVDSADFFLILLIGKKHFDLIPDTYYLIPDTYYLIPKQKKLP